MRALERAGVGVEAPAALAYISQKRAEHGDRWKIDYCPVYRYEAARQALTETLTTSQAQDCVAAHSSTRRALSLLERSSTRVMMDQRTP